MIPHLRYVNYPNWLRALNITTLETRRPRADLLQVFKQCNGLATILPADVFLADKTHFATSGPIQNQVHLILEYWIYGSTRSRNDCKRLEYTSGNTGLI